MDPVTYDLNRYMDRCDRAESLQAEADRQTADNLAEAIADCKASDEKLADALSDYWLDDARKFVRLALAMRCALGQADFTATTQYLDEIYNEAARAWAQDHHKVVTEQDVEEQAEDERADA